jgi:hypothetical protein
MEFGKRFTNLNYHFHQEADIPNMLNTQKPTRTSCDDDEQEP